MAASPDDPTAARRDAARSPRTAAGGGAPCAHAACGDVPRLTPESARERAAELVPALARRAAYAERLRRVPDETIEDLRRTGLLRLVQPARYGGSQLDLGTYLDVVLTLSTGCASTGWVYTNLASHAWSIALFDARAQDDVWGDDPDACAATGLAFPCGKARAVDGGYRLSGRWPFGSGVDASSWMMVGAMLERPGGGAPERRFFLVPAPDFRHLDNWHAMGLAATGSHDVEIVDAFVPEHRTLSAEHFASGRDTPGARGYGDPLYDTPPYTAFSYVLCTIPIGAARAAVEQFTDGVRARAGTYTGVRVAELANVQARIAEAAACAEFAEGIVRRDWQALDDDVRHARPIDVPTRLRWKRNAAFATSLAVRAVDALMPAAGAGGLMASSPLQRQFRDVHAASAHIGLAWDVHASAWAQSALGLALPPGMLL